MTCPYKDKCWRRSYTLYLKKNGYYENNIPPSRHQVFWAGLAHPQMTQFKESGGRRKYPHAMFAEVMPLANDTNTWCHMESGKEIEECHEYKREKKKEKRRVEKKKDYEKKYPHAKKRVHIPKDIRNLVSRRDKYTCFYCKCRFAHLKSIGVPCAIDHVVPIAKLLTVEEQTNPDNLVFACRDCNRQKADQDGWTEGCMEGKCGHHDKILRNDNGEIS